MNRPLFLVAATLFAATLAAPAAAFEVEGELHWSKRLTLSTPVSGVVEVAPVSPGQRVAKGALLVRLDPRPFEAKRERAAAKLAAADSALAEARREMERAEELYDRTVLSDHELQKAKIDFTAADSARRTARAELALTEVALERSVLTAPFDAWVITRSVEAGETVVSRLQARPLVELAEAGRMVVRVSVGADRAAKLKPGMAAAVTVNGDSYQGRVRAIAMEPPAGSSLYPVDVVFDSDQPLRAGQRAGVDLP